MLLRNNHDAEYIFNSVFPEPNSGCWIWMRSITEDGYPKLSTGVLAHRASYSFSVCEEIDGMDVDHTCKTRCCVNPDHLEAVRHQVNVRRKWDRISPDHCPRGHLYSHTALDGHIRCRVCAAENARNSRLRNK